MNLCGRLAADVNRTALAVAPALREAPRQEVAGSLPVALLDLSHPGIQRLALDFGEGTHGLLVEPHVFLAADVLVFHLVAQAALAQLKPALADPDVYPCAPARYLEVVALSQAFDNGLALGTDVVLLRSAVKQMQFRIPVAAYAPLSHSQFLL